jgi:hypothetical protein
MTTKLIGVAMLLLASAVRAQDAGDFKPAATNVLDGAYPRVSSDSRAEIRVKAPDATKVRLNFWSGPKLRRSERPEQPRVLRRQQRRERH